MVVLTFRNVCKQKPINEGSSKKSLSSSLFDINKSISDKPREENNDCTELMELEVMKDGTLTAINNINKPQTTSTINSDISDSSLNLCTKLTQEICHKRKNKNSSLKQLVVPRKKRI